MMNNKNIQPFVGYGDIPFGITADEVEKLHGVPTQRDEIDAVNDELSKCVFFEYADENFSIYFEGEDSTATSFSTTDEDAVLYGEKIFSLDKNGVKALLKKEGYAVEADSDSDEDCLICDDLMLDFYFEDDELVEVVFSA